LLLLLLLLLLLRVLDAVLALSKELARLMDLEDGEELIR
jgi:hypothetical protein